MKTGQGRLSVVQVNYAYDKGLTDPDELLARYHTLTGWNDALVGAGAAPVAAVQRFHRDADLVRNGVDYIFRRTGIAATVAARRPDIAHVNGVIFPARTWMLRRTLDRATAIVVQNHSDGGPIGRLSPLRLVGPVARGAVDAFLVAADEHADAWRHAGVIGRGQPAHQVMEASTALEPFGKGQGRPFDTAQGKPVDRAAAREASGLRGSPAMLWVGRLTANKDPLTVLDGFANVARDWPDATLTMIHGTDELIDAVRGRIRQSPALRDRVRLIARVPHDRMASFYSAADIFVVGSHHEGSGYSVIEACACGAVPVVTDIPTFRILTGGGSCGALWTPGDAASCARALLEVAGRDLEAERAKLAAHFARQLSWPAVGRRAMRIYKEVLGSRVPGSRSQVPGSRFAF